MTNIQEALEQTCNNLDKEINSRTKKWKKKLEQLEKLKKEYKYNLKLHICKNTNRHSAKRYSLEKELSNKKLDLLREKKISSKETLLKKLQSEITNFYEELNSVISSKKVQKTDLEQIYKFFIELKAKKPKNDVQLKQFYQKIVQLIEKNGLAH